MPRTLVSVDTSSERIVEVDILRGFALFGILVVNVDFATRLWSSSGTVGDLQPRFDGPFDHLVNAVVAALFSGRFYLLFALLFGYSFTLQIAAARRARASANARLLRRCLALLAIGLAHVFLLWIVDILTLYAVLCATLIPLRKLKPRAAVTIGVLLYVLWCGRSFLPGDGVSVLIGRLDLQRIHDGYAGTFGDAFATQRWLVPFAIAVVWFTQGVTSFGMFLIGMAAGERELFTDRETLRRWAPRVLTGGLVIGVPISAITFAGSMNWFTPPVFWFGVQELVNPLMTFAYMAGIICLTQSPTAAQIIGKLAPAGRMAASNYIGQSIVLMVVYTGYGFALADKLPPAVVIAIALFTYATQLAFSAWWLRTHRYGPVEWVLRSVTYLSIPEWKRSAGRNRTR
ncbi:DUF418 domain-containing protein [Nocardia colli]|uniref:DUF418 domain-containing protein n=1 Tax=Nocardia colli TaxID=2545717 RepID=UPI001CC3B2DD|nr:DUF418 domain-containing protein [Nocardia colli]